jgi:L-amino acid N-acyltransferase YncA
MGRRTTMRTRNNGVVGELDTLPGCTQVVVSHSVFVHKDQRGRGLGKEANANRLVEMRGLGYDYALCTVDKTNVAQLKILEGNGWTRLDSFKSSKTDHTVAIYGKEL